MKLNISKLNNCYGCGVCAIVCPEKIINVKLNAEGFYQPFISDTLCCTECKLCLDVCAFNHSDVVAKSSKSIASYACWSKNKETRYSTSSGGACYELSKSGIERGYKVIGVEYDANAELALHYMAQSVADLEKNKKSKYIPSFTLQGYSNINKKDKFVIIDTPCHIDSLRRYIKRLKIENNFLLIDFFCHGVPSMLLWKKYLHHAKKKTGKILKATWRNKTQEWNDSWENISKDEIFSKLDWQDSKRVKIWGEKGNYLSSVKKFDLYFSFFLGDRCLGKFCYDNCIYKGLASSADIRVGDFLGKTYRADKNGVSCILSFSDKGNEFVEYLSETCVLTAHAPEDITVVQMSENAKRAKSYSFVTSKLQTKASIPFISFIADFIDRKWKIFRITSKIKLLLKLK